MLLLLLIIEEWARLGYFDSNLDPVRSLYDIEPCWLCFNGPFINFESWPTLKHYFRGI